MSDMETTRLGLPLMQGAQAQKHVTLNESLVRLDGLVNLVLQEIGRTTPPTAAVDGQCYGIGVAAVNGWSGQDGRIAIATGGGWVFAKPVAGMRARNLATGSSAVHNGTRWIEGAITLSAFGSGLVAGMAEGEIVLTAGPTFTTPISIPPSAMVIGATGRVTQAITGTLASWMLGTPGALNRFGSGLGRPAGSWVRGMLGTPTTYYDSQPLVLSATDGNFSGGKLRLAVHWLELRLPD